METYLGIGVSKSFGSLKCLDDLAFEFPRRSIIGIVGENGSGKSTFLDLLTGYAQPDSGHLSYSGIRATRRSPEWFARRGVMRGFQNPRVFEQMTIRECLSLSHWVPRSPSILSALAQQSHFRERRKRVCEDTEKMLDYLGWRNRSEQKLVNSRTGRNASWLQH